MCGIVGYAGRQDAAPIIIDGLRRLEYRGYDSAGVAVDGDVPGSVTNGTAGPASATAGVTATDLVLHVTEMLRSRAAAAWTSTGNRSFRSARPRKCAGM